MITVNIRETDEFIKLGQALKKAGIVESGVDAKFFIQDGQVKLNGETELQRGKKLYNENKKVIEEANEFIEENSIEELGDLMEVINALMELKGYKIEDVYKVMKEKADKKGAFNNKIYLEYVDEEKRNLEEEKELNKEFRK